MLMEKKENDVFIFPRVPKWFCFLPQLGMNERKRKMRKSKLEHNTKKKVCIQNIT